MPSGSLGEERDPVGLWLQRENARETVLGVICSQVAPDDEPFEQEDDAAPRERPSCYAVAWEDGLGLSGDVDGDGIVGVGDILDILAFYGEPCAD